MTDILIISPTRAESGCLESVIAALPEAKVISANPGGAMAPYQSHANCMLDYTALYERETPRLVVVLGDRYETHAAALAAHFLRIPIAHIHGGETTSGAFDDGLRHQISHMAKLHFVATPQAFACVKELNRYHEDTAVHLVGAPGLDNIVQNSAKRDRPLIVVSYYSETLSPDYGLANCRAMLDALESYAKDHAIFFSAVNSDPGSSHIAGMIQNFIATYPHAASWISPNTREQYLHLCEHAQFAIGNSSSLVIELTWLGLPAVLIGDRQNGRPMAASVFQAKWSESIDMTISKAMRFSGNPQAFYRGGAAEKIAKIIREYLSCA